MKLKNKPTMNVVFFEHDPIVGMMDKKTVKGLTLASRAVCATAVKNIKKNKNESGTPGFYPYSKTGTLKRFIRYSVDRKLNVAYAGPLRVKQSKSDGRAPGLLARGGYYEGKNPFRKKKLKIGDLGIVKIDDSSAKKTKTVRGINGEEHKVVYGRIKTNKDLSLAIKNEEKAFGPERVRFFVKSRPYMTLALLSNVKKISGFFQ